MNPEQQPEPLRPPTSDLASGITDRGTQPAEPLLELMQSWRAGLGVVRRRKFLWLVLCLFTPGWLLAIYNWAALPLARPWQLALVAATGLILIALPAAALWLVFRAIDVKLLLTAQGYTSAMCWALLGVWLPHQMIWWVIPLESATLEGALAALRFVTADVIFSGSTLWLGAVLNRTQALRVSRKLR